MVWRRTISTRDSEVRPQILRPSPVWDHVLHDRFADDLVYEDPVQALKQAWSAWLRTLVTVLWPPAAVKEPCATIRALAGSMMHVMTKIRIEIACISTENSRMEKSTPFQDNRLCLSARCLEECGSHLGFPCCKCLRLQPTSFREDRHGLDDAESRPPCSSSFFPRSTVDNQPGPRD
jgi:hypothetical protein